MKIRFSMIPSLILGISSFLLSGPSFGHFLALIPATDSVTSAENSPLDLEISFMHPFAGERMDMASPARFAKSSEGQTQNLKSKLVLQEDGAHRWYKASIRLERPGDHVFLVDPLPYWEPAEEAFIRHQTKVVVNAFGRETGWNQKVGLRAEILPLTRPYGLWEGNLFTGKVLYKGQPVPSATIEVTLYQGADLIGDVAPVREIQVVRADANGVFSYAMPRPGWWGFAALVEDDQQLKGPDDKLYPVELGAVIWIHAAALD